ncbi:TatD family hydrolase [Colwellia sp. E2M01]|uniref:TatD family hydrolase n=1 Tax=Colwellia sp. E2M01 TaxID=2841561 RepID=UPI001C09EAF4|nr:TatD family hydrolase [Colwellia sp. E2M01]MBU2869290.1 TatD family hydrolase [Colwellia sp. E2M01]
MQFTDSHCHLDDIAFKEHLPELLVQCQQLNINRIIVPAISPSNFNQVLELAKNHHKDPICIYPCLGIHPWFLQDLNDTHLAQLTQSVKQARSDIIAIGEIGLDGAIAKKAEAHGQSIEDNWHHQQHFFDYQLNIANEQNLPVIIHHRQSHDKIMPFLKRYKLNKAGIIHGFSGSYQQAVNYIDLGFKLGVGSTITYSRAKKTINAIKRLPLTSLVLETDAPSMPLSKEVMSNEVKSDELLMTYESDATKKPNNSPVNIIQIFKVLTNIRTENVEEIANQLESNIEQVFFSHI